MCDPLLKFGLMKPHHFEKHTNKILAQAMSTLKISWESTKMLYRVILLKSLAQLCISHIYSANIA